MNDEIVERNSFRYVLRFIGNNAVEHYSEDEQMLFGRYETFQGGVAIIQNGGIPGPVFEIGSGMTQAGIMRWLIDAIRGRE